MDMDFLINIQRHQAQEQPTHSVGKSIFSIMEIIKSMSTDSRAKLVGDDNLMAMIVMEETLSISTKMDTAHH